MSNRTSETDLRRMTILALLMDGRSHALRDFEEIRLDFGAIKKTIRRDLKLFELVPSLGIESFNHHGTTFWRSTFFRLVGLKVEHKIKYCTRCRQHKSTDDFWKRADSKDGLERNCKICVGKDHARWQRRHRERVNAKNRKYRRMKKRREMLELGVAL